MTTEQQDLAKSELGAIMGKSRGGIVKTCPICGKTFTAKRPHAKFCSSKCNHAFFNRNSRRPTLTKTCPICGKVFETGRKDKVFCCGKCLRMSMRHERQPVERVCVFCGKTFASLSRNAKFCSPLCAGRRRSCGYSTLAEFEQAQAARHQAVANTGMGAGLTPEQMRDVIEAQASSPDVLWQRSQRWTEKQRKFARKRYEEAHGLFKPTWNP